jgi:HSP20 family protein
MLTRMLNEFAPLMRLQRDMDRLWDVWKGALEGAGPARAYGAAYPGINLWEEGDAAYLEAELPGLNMDDVEVLVAGNEVTLNGRRKIADPEGTVWSRRERAQGEFSRSVTLPWAIDADKVQATLRDGVLNVVLPKAESHKPRKVKVEG